MVPRIWLITDRSQIITVSAAADVFGVEGQINQILLIKSFVEAIPDLYQALLPAQAPLLAKARNLCDHEATSRILNNIQRVIEPDVTYMSSPLDLRNQRTFAVKAGMSGLLDVARQTYKELTEDIHEHVDAINGEL
jgi:DNA mismatch repair protein MSH4